MKFIDENGRVFGKISVIDLLVIAVVLVMAAALCVKNARLNTEKEEQPEEKPEQTITFQIRVNAMRNHVYRSLQVGDELRDRDYSSGPKQLGVITDIQVVRSPGTSLTALPDGTMEMVEMEDSVDLLITVECSGVVDDRSYSINGVYGVGIGSNRTYLTQLSQFAGTVANVY